MLNPAAVLKATVHCALSGLLVLLLRERVSRGISRVIGWQIEGSASLKESIVKDDCTADRLAGLDGLELIGPVADYVSVRSSRAEFDLALVSVRVRFQMDQDVSQAVESGQESILDGVANPMAFGDRELSFDFDVNIGEVFQARLADPKLLDCVDIRHLFSRLPDVADQLCVGL